MGLNNPKKICIYHVRCQRTRKTGIGYWVWDLNYCLFLIMQIYTWLLPGCSCFWKKRFSFFRFNTSISLFPLLDLLKKGFKFLGNFYHKLLPEWHSTDLANIGKKFNMLFRHDSFNSLQPTLRDKHSQKKFNLKTMGISQFTIWTIVVSIVKLRSSKKRIQKKSSETQNHLCLKMIFWVVLPLQ